MSLLCPQNSWSNDHVGSGFLIALAAIAALLLIELLARFWLRRFEKHYVLLPGNRTRVTWDTDFLRHLRSPIYRVINHEGERAPPPPTKTRGLYRVLLVGGSAAGCGLLDQDVTWSAFLHERLNRPDALARLGASRAHVGCVAKSLIDSSGLIIILRHIMRQYEHLKLIVILAGSADVLRWLSAGAPSNEVPRPLTESTCFSAFPGANFGWRPRRTAIAHIMRRIRSRWLRHIESIEEADRDYRREATARSCTNRFTELTSDPSAMLSNCRENLRVAFQIARSGADRVIVVRPPYWNKEVFTAEEELGLWHGRCGQDLHGTPQFLSTADLYSLLYRMGDVVQQAAVENGCEIVEPQAELDRIPNAFYDHLHFTEAGALVMADVITAKVLR